MLFVNALQSLGLPYDWAWLISQVLAITIVTVVLLVMLASSLILILK